MSDATPVPHEAAAQTFARQAREAFGDDVERIVLYGSVARGEMRGVNSDVDLIVVIQDHANLPEMEDRIRQLAYDIELEQGVVLSLIILSSREFTQESDRPFFHHVQRDGRTLYGST